MLGEHPRVLFNHRCSQKTPMVPGWMPVNLTHFCWACLGSFLGPLWKMILRQNRRHDLWLGARTEVVLATREQILVLGSSIQGSVLRLSPFLRRTCMNSIVLFKHQPFFQGFWWSSSKKDPCKEWKWKLPLESSQTEGVGSKKRSAPCGPEAPAPHRGQERPDRHLPSRSMKVHDGPWAQAPGRNQMCTVPSCALGKIGGCPRQTKQPGHVLDHPFSYLVDLQMGPEG